MARSGGDEEGNIKEGLIFLKNTNCVFFVIRIALLKEIIAKMTKMISQRHVKEGFRSERS